MFESLIEITYDYICIVMFCFRIVQPDDRLPALHILICILVKHKIVTPEN